MTNEEKELLLKDLFARLPHGVIIKEEYGDYISVNIYNANIEHLIDRISAGVDKLVLRPMSSMTEEERNEYNMHLHGITVGVDAMNFMIWIYQHHLDICGLIPRDLASPAPEGMYN